MRKIRKTITFVHAESQQVLQQILSGEVTVNEDVNVTGCDRFDLRSS